MHSIKLYNSLKQIGLRKRYPLFRMFSNLQDSKSFVLASFEGKAETDQVFPYPKVLSAEQEDLIRQMVEPTIKFFQEKNNALKNDELEALSPELENILKNLGAYGLMVPEDYSGVGLNNTQYARLTEVVGSHDLGVGIVLGAHQSIGYKGIVLYGTEEQKQKYLPSLAKGEKIAAYCLTEPSSGSDANSIQTKAVKSADGKYYTLNGSKIWISNGGTADVFTIFAKTIVKDDKGIEKEKITAFIAEREFGGITHSPPEKKMGIKCSNTAALFIEDCKVPVENVLGGEGNGFKVAMNILNNGRFGMAASLAGTMKMCISKSIQHAKDRKQFTSKISEYGVIQEKLARMAVKHYITESMAYVVAGNMDRGIREYQAEAAISKVYSSESAWFCCDEAIQIHGGMGFMRECGLEKVLRDLRVFRIFEGASEILRLFTVAQGLLHIRKNYKGSAYVAKLMKNKLGMDYKNTVKKLNAVVHPKLTHSASKLAYSIALFGSEVFSAMINYKEDIINQQFHLIRFADCAMEIYGMAVALSRATNSLNNNYQSAQYEAQIVELACNLGSERVQEIVHLLQLGVKEDFKRMKNISEELCKFGGVIQPNPLGF